MKHVVTICGVAAPLPMANVDTDVIIRIEQLAQCPREQLGAWGFGPLRFRADGSEILYTDGRSLLVVAVTHGATLSASEPRVLMTVPKDQVAGASRPDHQRFLFAIPDGDSPKQTLTLLSGWVVGGKK